MQRTWDQTAHVSHKDQRTKAPSLGRSRAVGRQIKVALVGVVFKSDCLDGRQSNCRHGVIVGSVWVIFHNRFDSYWRWLNGQVAFAVRAPRRWRKAAST